MDFVHAASDTVWSLQRAQKTRSFSLSKYPSTESVFEIFNLQGEEGPQDQSCHYTWGVSFFSVIQVQLTNGM